MQHIVSVNFIYVYTIISHLISQVKTNIRHIHIHYIYNQQKTLISYFNLFICIISVFKYEYENIKKKI